MFNQTSARTAEDAVLNCQVCGQVMGTYEPMIVLSPEGGVREASLLQLEELGLGDVYYHPSCYPW